MELKGLTGGGPHRAVAIGVRQAVERQIQLGRNTSAGAAQTQHHSPVLLLAFLSMVAVVLLVAAVKFEDLHGLVGEERQLVLQFRCQWFAQVLAARLQQLEFALLGGG